MADITREELGAAIENNQAGLKQIIANNQEYIAKILRSDDNGCPYRYCRECHYCWHDFYEPSHCPKCGVKFENRVFFTESCRERAIAEGDYD